MKKPLTNVSDHAVLRYLERVCGIDIEAIRIGIGRRVDDAARAGACAVHIDGFVYRIEHRNVVTVKPRNFTPLSSSGKWDNDE